MMIDGIVASQLVNGELPALTGDFIVDENSDFIITRSGDRIIYTEAAGPQTGIYLVIMTRNFNFGVDSSSDVILEGIDLSTKSYTHVSSNLSPSSVQDLRFSGESVITYDSVNDKIIQAGVYSGNFATKILEVDPITGERTIISGDGIPNTQENFGLSDSLNILSNGDILAGERDLIRIDRTTGQRTEISDINSRINQMVVQEDRNRVICACGSNTGNRIVSVDLTTGVNTDVIIGNTGDFYRGLAYNPNNDTFYYCTRPNGEIRTVDSNFTPSSIQVFTNNTTPNTVLPLSEPEKLAYDSTSDILYVTCSDPNGGSQNRIVTVNGTTGEKIEEFYSLRSPMRIDDLLIAPLRQTPTPPPQFTWSPMGIDGVARVRKNNQYIEGNGDTFSTTLGTGGSVINQPTYFEVQINGELPGISSVAVGISNVNAFTGFGSPPAIALNEDGNVIIPGSFYSPIGSYSPTAYTDIIMIAINPADETMWLGLNGEWMDGGNPSANTFPTVGPSNRLPISGSAGDPSFWAVGDLYLYCNCSGNVNFTILNPDRTVYTVPTGYVSQ